MLILYGLLLVFFYSGNGIHVVIRPIRILITLIGCLSIVYLMFNLRHKSSVENYIFYAITLHSIIMIIQFLYPDFKMFIYQYTVDIQKIQGARMFYSVAGLTTGGGAQLSLYQSLGVLITPLVLMQASSFKYKLVIYTCSLACLISVLISGRSGLIAILVFFPIIYLFSKNKDRSSYNLIAIKIIKFLFLFLIIFSTILFALNSNFSFLSHEVFHGAWGVLIRTEELLTGQSGTLMHLFEKHLIPIPDVKTFLFGNPELLNSDFKSSERILNSDIGYIRILFSYGVLGSILHYLFYIIIIYFSYNIFKYQKGLKDLALFSLIFSIIILIFNAKEVVVFTRIGLSISAIVLFYLLHAIHLNKKNSHLSDSY
tara:strand:- start:2113 stop:3222 length:1110 start_codon:yes stop_codon:yes gene_type:complete